MNLLKNYVNASAQARLATALKLIRWKSLIELNRQPTLLRASSRCCCSLVDLGLGTNEAVTRRAGHAVVREIA